MTPFSPISPSGRYLQAHRAHRPRQLLLTNSTEDGIRARELIVAQLLERRFTQQEVFGIRLALEESLVNARTHGNAGDPTKFIFVSYFVSDFGAWIRVEDQGAGFNPRNSPDTTLAECHEHPGGRGLTLIRHYMDRVQFNQQGNAVTMERIRRREYPS